MIECYRYVTKYLGMFAGIRLESHFNAIFVIIKSFIILSLMPLILIAAVFVCKLTVLK